MFVSNLSNLDILKDRICCDLREGQIVSCNLDTMSIDGFNWIETSIDNSNLNEVTFKKCVLDQSTFFRSNMEKVKFDYTDIINETTFSGITFIKSVWHKVKMSNSYIKNSTMMRSTIDSCYFDNVNFIDYEGVYASINKTIFRNCRFCVTSDNGMNGFYGTKFNECFFINCDFMGFPLRESIVNNCIFVNNTGHITDGLESNSSIGLSEFTQDAFQKERKLHDYTKANDLIKQCMGG